MHQSNASFKTGFKNSKTVSAFPVLEFETLLTVGVQRMSSTVNLLSKEAKVGVKS